MRFGGLIAAIVFAAIAAVVVLRMSGDDSAPATGENAPQLATTNIYVAAQPIPVGTTLTQDMIVAQPWPSHLVLNGFLPATEETVVAGMVTRAAFQPQEPIISSKLSNPSDPNFLAGALPKGMRVITLQTNEIEGLAGFVFPGDYVDVILTHEIKKWITQPSSDPAAAPTLVEEIDAVTETLLTNVKVLAVDQRASGAGSTDEKGNLIIPRSISLMVSPTDAQRLRLGAERGTLTLALRSLSDRESADPLTITAITDISQAPAYEAGATDSINVVRGIKREAITTMSPGATGAVTPAPVTP